VIGRKLLVTLALGQTLRRLHEPARAIGVLLEIHVFFPRPILPPLRRGKNIFIGSGLPAMK
jgi:hypothetical protein